MAGNRPVWRCKYGSVEIACFEKETEKYGVQQSFSVSKSWKDKNEKWQTQVFYFKSATEIVNMIQCCQKALEFHYLKTDKPSNIAVNKPEQTDIYPI